MHGPSLLNVALGFALMLAAPVLASAHGSNPAVAWLNEPIGVGNVVDRNYTFTWVDADVPIPTGTATIDFHFTRRRPPAFANGEIHPQLFGEIVVTGIIEKQLDNTYSWDTSQVPAGSYFIWSKVIEPPEEPMAPQIISFSPGVLTVAHPGDEVHPALILTTPNTPFGFAKKSYTLRWHAFDPDSTGRVKLEAGTSSLGADFALLADDLAASQEAFEWDTSDLEETDWYIRATISDARGLTFTTYARHLLLVTRRQSTPDAGYPADAEQVSNPPPEGCICVDGEKPDFVGLWLLGAIITVLRRRIRSARRRIADKPARRGCRRASPCARHQP